MNEQEKLAVIDIGTNTFHLLIAEMNERDEFVVREKYKIPVKLGEGGITSGKIGEKAFDRGIKALKRIKKLIDSKKAKSVSAFATSAVRSASNGAEFIAKAKEEADISIRVINGNEEASLIFEGVKNGVHLPFDQDTLIVDIGGGSVEFIVARENKPLLLRSLDIGAARMLEMFKPSDPITPAEIKNIQTWLHTQLDPLLHELRQFNLQLMVGSSGTFESLATLIAHERKDLLSAENLNSYIFAKKDFISAHKKIITSDRAARLELAGMEPMRVELIVMGTLLVDLLLKELKMNQVMISLFALKEGIFYNFLDEKRERVNYLIGNTAKNLRAKSVRNMVRKYGVSADHGLKVSELSIQLFDLLQPLHNLGDSEREMLKYSAMLHDVGYYINHSSHHKHGQYLIMNGGLNGFSNDELLLMGNLVRYHRKSLPTRDHFHFKILSQAHRLIVRQLSGILRICDNLDRGHRGFVDHIWSKIDARSLHIFVEASEHIDIEIAAANENKHQLEEVFRRKVTIEEA